jgi:putative membrane protein
MMYGYGPCGMMGPWMGAGFIWIILVLLLVAAVYLIVRSARQSRQGESPLDILKMRYARGEITKEEFEGKKKDLGL